MKQKIAVVGTGKELLNRIANDVKAMKVSEVIKGTDQIVIATPFHALDSTLKDLGDLSLKINI